MRSGTFLMKRCNVQQSPLPSHFFGHTFFNKYRAVISLATRCNASADVYQDLKRGGKKEPIKSGSPPLGYDLNHLNPISKVHLQTSWNKGKTILRNNKEG